MRLLNALTRRLEDFGHDGPRYYILSHRWTDQEVSFKDFHKQRVTQGQGYEKIVNFCNFALSQDYRRGKQGEPCYVWVDTCCIDKRSSAELSEAINSMYRFYAEADVCYVYLSDVSLHAAAAETHDNLLRKLKASKWFTRGWTLQELLAPMSVVFVDSRWDIIGHKCSSFCQLCRAEGNAGPNLNAIIAAITGIDEEYLSNRSKIRTASIARRMSWAARRETSRLEDTAYCLLGIFDVHIPLIYGEGPKAFHRLQEEIIKHSTDMSIFAWAYSSTNFPWRASALMLSGLLARHVSDFEHSADIVQQPGVAAAMRFPYTLTNAGLNLRTFITPTIIDDSGMAFEIGLVELNCGVMVPSCMQQHDNRAPLTYMPVEIALISLPNEDESIQGPLLFERIGYDNLSFNAGRAFGEGEDVSLYVKAFEQVHAFSPFGRRRVVLNEGEEEEDEEEDDDDDIDD